MHWGQTKSSGLVTVVSVFWAIGVPFLCAGFLLTEARTFSYVFYAACVLLLFICVLRSIVGLGVPLPISVFAFYWLFLLALLLATIRSQLFLPFTHEVFQFQSLLGFGIWTMVLLLLPQFFRSDRELTRLLWLFDLAGIAIAATVFASFAGVSLGETLFFDTGEQRAFGPFGDQVGFVLSFFAVRAISLRHWVRFAYFATAILATATRGALITTLVGIALVIILDTRQETSKTNMLSRPAFGRRIALLLLVSLLLLALTSTPFASFVMERFTNPQSLDVSALQRIGSMSLALDVASDYPWLGVGFYGYSGAVWNYSPFYYFPIAHDPAIVSNFVATTSNQFLQTLTDGGVVALTALICLIVSSIWILNRARTVSRDKLRAETTGLLGWCTALVVANQTACWLLPDSLITYIWFLGVGIGVAVVSCVTRTPVLERASLDV